MQEAMTVRYSEKAANTPAFSLIVEGFNWLVQEKLSPEYGNLGIDWDDEVLFIYAKGEALACLVYRKDPKINGYVVHLAFVEPSSRRQGMFRTLMEELRRRASSHGLQRIRLTVPEVNTPALDAVEAVGGFFQTALRYEMEL